ncbi:MAG: CHAP domain-containing protein [Bacteroidia bacterium]
MKRWLFISTFLFLVSAGIFFAAKNKHLFQHHEFGDVLDSLNGVRVYYNGTIDHIEGRNRAADGYNLGLKYQCVEFVKRYYYEHYKHKMPVSYGNAKDFFDVHLTDGDFNSNRGLRQYTNGSRSKPEVGDLLVMGGNAHGHVAIVSEVGAREIEIIQQNPGVAGNSRRTFSLRCEDELWTIKNERILGWLRKEK